MAHRQLGEDMMLIKNSLDQECIRLYAEGYAERRRITAETQTITFVADKYHTIMGKLIRAAIADEERKLQAFQAGQAPVVKDYVAGAVKEIQPLEKIASGGQEYTACNP